MKTSSKKNRKPKMSLQRSIALILVFSIVALFVLLFSGCKVKEVIRYVPVVQTRDSVVVKIVRDTVTVYPKQANQVIGVKKSHLETDLAKSDAAIGADGLLSHSIENKGVIPSKLIYEKTEVRDTIQVPYVVEVPVPGKPIIVEIPVKGFYYQFGVWTFYILLVLIALAIFIAVKYPATNKKIKLLLKNIKNK